MGLHNDENFNYLYNEGFEKIPGLFRFGKKKLIFAVVTGVVSIIAASIFLILFYDSGEYVTTHLGLYESGYNVYNYTYLVIMIIFTAIVILMSGWITIAKLFERRAFTKAARLSNMIYLSERIRDEKRWQDWKMKNRSY